MDGMDRFMAAPTVSHGERGEVTRIVLPSGAQAVAEVCRVERAGRRVRVVEVTIGGGDGPLTRLGLRPWQIVRLMFGRSARIDRFEVRP